MEWPASDFVAHHARSQPDRLACLDLATERRWSYAQLDTAIQRAVTTLRRRYDIGPGQRVAVIARNSADLLILQQAATRIGAIFVPINWRLAPPEQSRILADCAPRLLVRDEAMTPPEWPEDCRAVAHSILTDQMSADDPAARLPSPPADAPSIILYTSGTSGLPKGVVISERAMLATAINFGILAQVGHSSVFLCDTPMFHVIGLVTSLRAPLLHGGSVLISAGFDPGTTNRRLADPALGVTHYFCVPQMADMLRRNEDFAPGRWASLIALFTGGAPNPAANIRWWLERGVAMVDGYGMTEAGTILGMPLDPQIIARKAGSAGLPAPMLSLRIVDPSGRDLPAGEPGELLVAGPNLMLGYWNLPEETAGALTPDGWLRTGDIGRMDEDGFVTLVDRRKDMFISGGENVFPVEVEAALLLHPDVAEVAVLGMADPDWGEVGHAYIVLEPGKALDGPTLADHCSQHLARFKVPRHFHEVEALPRTASGKIQKHLLRR